MGEPVSELIANEMIFCASKNNDKWLTEVG